MSVVATRLTRCGQVNGCPAVASNTDSLEEVVPGRFRDAEIFDICYRCETVSSS